MKHPAGGRGPAGSVAALVATALLARDLPIADADEVDAAARYVDQSIAAMPDVTRLGVAMASGLAYVALSTLGRAPYRRQSPERRAATAARLAETRLPVLREFGRLTRGLAIVGVVERRTRTGSLP